LGTQLVIKLGPKKLLLAFGNGKKWLASSNFGSGSLKELSVELVKGDSRAM
jgi:hypothetical protein